MNNGFETLCTGDEALNMFAVGVFLVESSRAMFCKSHGNAYKWRCSIYLDLGFEMLVKVFEGFIFVPFVQVPRLLLHRTEQLHCFVQNVCEFYVHLSYHQYF